MQLTGRVTVVTVKKVKYGNKTSIKIDGNEEWYGTFKSAPPIERGNLVSFDASQSDDGVWWNMDNVQVIGGNGGAATATDPGAYFDKQVPPTAPVGFSAQNSNQGNLGRLPADPEREARIVRQNATSSAIAFVRLQVDVAPEHFKNLTTDELWEELWGRVVEYQGRIYELNMNAPQGA